MDAGAAEDGSSATGVTKTEDVAATRVDPQSKIESTEKVNENGEDNAVTNELHINSCNGDMKPIPSPGLQATPQLRKPSIIVTDDKQHSTDLLNPSAPEPIKLRKADNKGWMRHVVAILALSSIVLANMNRQAFNQALVSMARPMADKNGQENHSQHGDLAVSTVAPNYLLLNDTESPSAASLTPQEPNDVLDDRFDWTGAQIATLQSAFSYGYTPFMIPGGRMSELYGAKWVVFLSGFGSALCCLLSPLFADTNYYLLVGSRILMGFCQTGVSPALYALLTRWMPPDESSVYLPMIKVGVMVGFMAGSLVSGFFTWRVTFYLVGAVGVLWSVVWTSLVTSDPADHKLVKKKELDYIRREITRLNKGRKQSVNSARKASAPWFNIFTNPVVLGFMFAKFTVKLSTEAQTAQIQMYLKSVFHVSKELNGLLSALNFAIQGIFTGLVAWLAKEFVVRKSFGLSKTGVRRLFQGICNFGMCLAYVMITFNMSSLGIVCCAVVVLSVAAMFGAGGEAVTPVDLSTDYSASIMAIANSSANLSGIILPSLVSFIMDSQYGDAERWNIVWWIVAGIMALGGFVYVTVVTAEIQDFNKKSKDELSQDLDKSTAKHLTTVIEMEDKSKIERL